MAERYALVGTESGKSWGDVEVTSDLQHDAYLVNAVYDGLVGVLSGSDKEEQLKVTLIENGVINGGS
jgi:hypothetical protein